MNPLITAAIAAKANAPAQPSGSSWGFGRIAGFTLLGAGLFFGGRYLYKKYQANRQDGKANEDATQLALRLYQAMDGMGTDETAIFQTLAEIQDWQAVSDAYRSKYGTSLINDLQNELNGDDFKRAMDIVKGTGGKGGKEATVYAYFASGAEILQKVPGPYWPDFRTAPPNTILNYPKVGEDTHLGKNFYIFALTGKDKKRYELAVSVQSCRLLTEAESVKLVKEGKIKIFKIQRND